MRLYDDRDIAIVAQCINSVAPDSIEQRARLIVQAAMVAGVNASELSKAIDWWSGDA